MNTPMTISSVKRTAVGLNGSAIIYTHRREKDLEFIRRNDVNLIYAFWNHSVSVEQIHYLSDLRAALAASVSRVVLIPAPFLHEKLKDRPSRVLNTKTKTPSGRLGYGTNGYGRGWSIPYRELLSWATFANVLSGLKIYNNHVADFSVYVKE